VVAGQDAKTADLLCALYGAVVKAGTFRASSIKVAEAAKVIENTQRDLNIALMNELAAIFDRMGIDTLEVLEAAGTKWNFLPFRPGLVGGHCIGVDRTNSPSRPRLSAFRRASSWPGAPSTTPWAASSPKPASRSSSPPM
jgi:hypothetical protein